MKNFFTWLNEFYHWKMFQWIWGLTTKQAAHIRKRQEEEEDEHKILQYESRGGITTTMEVTNVLF